MSKPIEHGTAKGYGQHYHRGDVARWNAGLMAPCLPCLNAHRDAHSGAPRPSTEAAFRASAVGKVPNEVLGVLIASAPADVAEWVREQLGDWSVDRALWWAGQRACDAKAVA